MGQNPSAVGSWNVEVVVVVEEEEDEEEAAFLFFQSFMSIAMWHDVLCKLHVKLQRILLK